MGELVKRIGLLCVALSVLAGCSPTSTFDGLSAGFARLENNLADAPDKAEDTTPKPDVRVAGFGPAGPSVSADRREINSLIRKYARHYNVPEKLVHRVVNRESTYRPDARNGIHLGLMQLNPQTARTMGYRGPDSGLLNADTNLKYGVKYLRGALMVAQGDHDRADRLYQTGYYYHAKHMGLLQATGLRP